MASPEFPDPFDDIALFGDRPELGPKLISSHVASQEIPPRDTFQAYVDKVNADLKAKKRDERIQHLRRARQAGQFVFRHKVASITGAVVVGAAVSHRLLHKR